MKANNKKRIRTVPFFIIFFILLLFMFACSTKKGVVKEDIKKSMIMEETKEIKEEEEVELKGKNVWVKEWNVLVYSNTGYDSGVVEMVKKGDRLNVVKQKDGWYKVKTGELEGWIGGKFTSIKEVKGIEISKKILTQKEKKQVGEYVNKGKEFLAKTDPYYLEDGDYIKAWRNFYNAYKIDPNNLEAIKGIINCRYDTDLGDPEEMGLYEMYGLYEDKQKIELCNRALALNPPDKEWWYYRLSCLFTSKSPKLSLFFSFKGLEYLKREKDIQSKFYPEFLYNIADLSKKSIVKRIYYEKLISNYQNWNLDNPDKININAVKHEYNNLLKKLK